MKITENKDETFQGWVDLFDGVLKNTNIGICIVDSQGHVQNANNYLCKTLGYCPSEIINMSISDITHYSSNIESDFFQQLTNPKTTQSSLETACLHKNGNIVFMEVYSSPIKNIHELQPHFIVHMVDITERKNKEIKSFDSDEKLRTFYELSPLGILLTDIHGNFLDSNNKFELICGYTKDELKEFSFLTLIQDEAKINIATQLETVKKTRKYGPYEKEYIRKDGSLVPVRVNGALLTDSKGNQYIWSFFKDISDQRKIVKNIYLASAAVEKSRNAFFWIGSNGEVRFANDFACQNLGYTKDELIGMSVWDFDPDFSQEMQSPVFNEIKQNGVAIFESRHIRKNGSIFPVEITANYFVFETEELVFCAVHDITARKNAEQNLLLTQFAIEQSSVAVYQLDVDSRILYANGEACQNLGYSAEELRKLSVTDIDLLYNKDEWPGHWRTLRNLKSLSFETIQRRKDGSTFPAEVSANFIAYDGMEYNFAFVRDISERKLVEKEIQLAATTFDSQEAIIVTDAEANILRVNKAFTKITGFTSEDVVGNKPSMFSSGYHDDSFVG
jgi:PAS domain S-box-containing protein